ncbi:MAG: Hint domain-containing protein [Caulobacteraceae bacterium]|jgi:hypothetical protein
MSETFTYTGTIEHVTVAASGTYTIDVDGAQGGQSTFAGENGGLGAAVGGDIFLAAGTQLEIVVGGDGYSDIWGGGGGGASYVIETFNGTSSVDTILAIAGGGGGGGVSGVGGGGIAGPNGDDGAGASGGLADDNGLNGAGEGGGNSGGGGGGFTGGGGAPNIGESGLDGGHTGVTFLGGDSTDPGGGGFGGGGAGGGYGGTGFHGGGGGGGGLGGGGGGTNSGGGGGGSYLASGFTHTFGADGDSSEGHAGNGEITITPPVCFCSGTLIRTTRGEVAVEDLTVGDLAVTASGEARPIIWIGHKRILRPSRVEQPVRVAPDAIGEGLPARRLRLSPGHAVCLSFVEEVFVPVSELINDATIVREAVGEVTYWHVELETHDVLLAEGLPCESYMDAGNRAFFGRQYGRLETIDAERVAESLTRYARPFVIDEATTAAMRRRLEKRAERLAASSSTRASRREAS